MGTNEHADRRTGAAHLVVAVTGLLFGAATLAPAHAFAQDAPPLEAATSHVAAQILHLAGNYDSEPLIGLPPVPDLAAGRARTMADPAFWTSYVGAALNSGVLVLPKPIDAVRPEMYLPTVRVEPGTTSTPLREQAVDLLDVTYEWQGQAKRLGDYLHTTESDGIAFVHDGVLVAEYYANGWSADIRHQPWSVTKSFVSALVGIAVDDGLVRSVEDPIDSYINDLAGTAWEGVTIRNLLEMASGVHWDEATPVLVENTQVLQWVELALDLYTDGTLGQTRNEFLMSLPRFAEPGTVFSYNSGNTQVLAWLLETVHGRPFNEILSTELWQPARMAGDALVMTDRVGDAVASQGLYARMHDFIRFGELFRIDGRTPDGVQVVSEAWVGDSTTFTDTSDGTYGYQWWVGAIADDFEASGFEGNKITVSPGSCLTAVRLSHQLGGDFRDGDDPLDADSYGFEVEMGQREWHAAYRAVAARLGGCPEAATTPTAGGPVKAEVRSEATEGSQPATTPLPATGGAAAPASLLALALAGLLRRAHAGSRPRRRRL